MSLAPEWGLAERVALDELAALGPRSVLVLHDNVPRFDASGADLRLLQVCEVLAAAGHTVTFVGRSGGEEAHHRARLEASGIEVFAPDPERVFWAVQTGPRVDLEALLRERGFDFALMYHWYWTGVAVTEQYEPWIRRVSAETKVVVIMDDVHWLREERRAQVDGDRTALERARGLRVKELETYQSADLMLTISPADARHIRADAPELPMGQLSFCRETICEDVPGFDDRAEPGEPPEETLKGPQPIQ